MDMAICRMKQGQGSDAQKTVLHISLGFVNPLFSDKIWGSVQKQSDGDRESYLSPQSGQRADIRRYTDKSRKDYQNFSMRKGVMT